MVRTGECWGLKSGSSGVERKYRCGAGDCKGRDTF